MKNYFNGGSMKSVEEILKEKMDSTGLQKLDKINNQNLKKFVADFIELCNPEKVFVSDGSKEDIEYIRKKAIENHEEANLRIKGHKIHFDAYGDQGRDKANTKILLEKGAELDERIVTGERELHLKEIREILSGIMAGREVFVCFYTLGPANSIFSIPCVQMTDSAYVAHSENILYRQGYEEFVRQGENARFFKFIHSEGELNEHYVSKNLDKRRIYIDLKDETVYSVNTQYGGNTIGLKKLAMRLAIDRCSREGWLTEHMLVMGVHENGGSVTYLTGAFPSMCGKTSTAMLEGESIVGDDIAYLKDKSGRVFAVNVEKGMFGIIQGVNSKDDPIQWKALHTPDDVIFSNVLLLDDGSVYWIGKDDNPPEKGYNHSGEWYRGKVDQKGKEVTTSHPNARFTLSVDTLDNIDPKYDDPEGVPVGGMIYGGRDSDTWVPVCESFDWKHGIITKGASIESETTAATLGKEGVREFNPMSNLDFLSIPIGKYIDINLKFGEKLSNPPLIFGVNYFLKNKEGNFLNEKNDKKVWLKWMAKRINHEASALKSPIGFIPKFADLKVLFKEILDKGYTFEDYTKQFTIRIPENLAKNERIRSIYSSIKGTPASLFDVLDSEKQRLLEAREKIGDYITPDKLPEA